MDYKILNLTVCGVKNISKPVRFDFYKKYVDHNSCFDDYRVKGIYGENGSGKTAVILAVKLLKNLVTDPYYLNDVSVRETLNEIVNKQNRKGYVEVLACAQIEGRRYIYNYRIDFKINEFENFEISHEEMHLKLKNSRNKDNLLYKIENGKITYYFNKANSEWINSITQNLLSNQTLASVVLRQLSLKDTDESLIDAEVIGFVVICQNIFISIDKTDDYKDKYLYQRVSQLFDTKTEAGKNTADNYLYAVHSMRNELSYLISKEYLEDFYSYVKGLKSFVQIFKSDLKDIVVDKTESPKQYRCALVFVYNNYRVSLAFESTGIKKIVNLYNALSACCDGNIVFIDELDLGINSIYLSKIIEYIANYAKGQLCFTAHDLGIMKVLKDYKKSIDFLSSVNTVHSWSRKGNTDPESAYRKGFIEDSPYNIDAVDFIGVFGGNDE